MLPARANPFRADRIEALRFRLDECGWRALLNRFTAHNRRGLLVGPHGSGKTTLREELEQRLRCEGFSLRSLVLGDQRRVSWADLRHLIADADARTIISLDGIDRIPLPIWWCLRQAIRHVGGILATSHIAGRLALLHQHLTSPTLLMNLIEELTDTTTATALRDHSQALYQRHQGDLRACLRSLYDLFADQTVDDAVLQR